MVKISFYKKAHEGFYNEKIAFEVALSFSWSGKGAVLEVSERGLPELFDPLLSASYIGTAAPFVLHVRGKGLAARSLGFFSKCPVIVGDGLFELAFEVSDRFNLPVIWVSEASPELEVVEEGFSFDKNPKRWAATPRFRYVLHRELNEKLLKIQAFLQGKGEHVRWVGSGRELVSEVPREENRVLVIPFSHPLPLGLVRDFLGDVECQTDSFPIYWQSRGFLKLRFTEDCVGGEAPRFEGGFVFGRRAIGLASGMRRFSKSVVGAVLDETEFLHSGIPSLINAYYNGAELAVVLKVGGREGVVRSVLEGMGIEAKRISSLDEVGREGGFTVYIWKN